MKKLWSYIAVFFIGVSTVLTIVFFVVINKVDVKNFDVKGKLNFGKKNNLDLDTKINPKRNEKNRRNLGKRRNRKAK